MLNEKIFRCNIKCMREFYTNALVLGRKDINDYDAIIHLYTEKFGKIRAKAKSIRKITSKLSAHFQPLVFVKTRVILSGLSNGFIILDGILDDFTYVYKTTKRIDLLPIIDFFNDYSFDLQKDRRMWHFFRKIFSGNYDNKEVSYILLALLGIYGRGVGCIVCGSGDLNSFHKEHEGFLCKKCSLKFNNNDIIYIKKIDK